MPISYLRLTTGEEIMAEVTEGLNVLTLTNPLQIEYGELDEGVRLPFLSRYNPYSATHEVKMDRSHVMMVTDMGPEATQYYKTSLEYCETVADGIINERLIDADQYLRENECSCGGDGPENIMSQMDSVFSGREDEDFSGVVVNCHHSTRTFH